MLKVLQQASYFAQTSRDSTGIKTPRKSINVTIPATKECVPDKTERAPRFNVFDHNRSQLTTRQREQPGNAFDYTEMASSQMMSDYQEGTTSQQTYQKNIVPLLRLKVSHQFDDQGADTIVGRRESEDATQSDFYKQKCCNRTNFAMAIRANRAKIAADKVINQISLQQVRNVPELHE